MNYSITASAIGAVLQKPNTSNGESIYKNLKYDNTEENVFVGSKNLTSSTFLIDSNMSINKRVIIDIKTLKDHALRQPITVVIESDDEGFLASTIDLPLYANGEFLIDAVQNIKQEILSLFQDLNSDAEENYSTEWKNYRRYLNKIIVP